MKNRQLALPLGILASIILFISACKKINEATELGGGLIPPIDNITTFDTTLEVQAFNDTFSFLKDSARIARSDEHFLGMINNDPFFGKTDARIFMEIKPSVYGTYPFARKDSVKIDSVVLVLDYAETYGDTNIAQTINVYEIDNVPANNFKYDSAYLVRQENFTYSSLLGSRSVLPSTLNDSIKAFRDTTINQLRIKLDTNFARRMFNYDTSGAYKSDSAFKTFFKGFVLRSMGPGNAVMGFGFGTTNTKLAFYYRIPKTGAPGDTTTVSYFFFTERSGAANYVKRDYTNTPVETAVGGASPDPLVYIQNTPGTFATIKIPGLVGLSNRVVHRAELIMEQVYDPSDTVFYPPVVMFLDAYDTNIAKFRTIPYDLATGPSGAIDFGGFGIFPVNAVDGAGHKIRTWHFNLSRYIQHILTGTQKIYDLRLSAPFVINDQIGIPGVTADQTLFQRLNPTLLKGRIRLAGGVPGPQRMRLRIIYSKL